MPAKEILREHGLDWQALKMPKGQENPIYQTYVKRDTPTIAIVSPNGYVAFVSIRGAQATEPMNGGCSRCWPASGRSRTTRVFFNRFTRVSFLVMQPDGDFDPAAPPELKAIKQAPISVIHSRG